MIHLVVKSSGIDLREVWNTVDRRFLLLGFVIYGLGMVVGAYRWCLLLHHIGVKLALGVVVRLTFIGQFFNLFVPGGVGGDLIKMVYLKRESGERYAEAVLSVLLDRILGLMGLLLLALLAVLLQPSLLRDSAPEMKAILLVVGLAGFAGAVAAIFFVSWPYLGKLASRMSGLREKLPAKLRGLSERLLSAVSLLRSSPVMVFKLLGLSMLVHFMATLAITSVGTGVGGCEQVSLQEFLLSTQLANLVGAVPLTPGGLGGRDLALAFLLTMSGAEDTATGAVPIVVSTLLILWSCVGGLALLWERKTQALEAPGDAED